MLHHDDRSDLSERNGRPPSDCSTFSDVLALHISYANTSDSFARENLSNQNHDEGIIANQQTTTTHSQFYAPPCAPVFQKHNVPSSSPVRNVG